MTGKLKYLLLLIVSICYLQAAFEINTDTITNTWGDELDTYIQADNFAIPHIQKIEQSSHYFLLSDYSFSYQVKITDSYFPSFSNSFASTSPHKLFLKNCSLLI
jgi:hypothetical protein